MSLVIVVAQRASRRTLRPEFQCNIRTLCYLCLLTNFDIGMDGSREPQDREQERTPTP
jgi:hypothetical protein